MSELTPIQTLKLPEIQERFAQIAPASMSYQAEISFAMQSLMANEYLYEIAQRNPQSLKSAISNVAAIGLTLNPAEKQAYLLPRDGVVCLDPSYVGLIRLATDSGSIKWVQANIVHEGDEFIDNGAGEKPTHSYKAFAKDRGDMVGVYSVAKTDDGDYLTTIMTMEELINIRDRSELWKKKKKGPWLTDFNEQAKKTVIRRAFKTWPRSVVGDRMALAVDISNENEGFEPIINSPNIEQPTVDQNEYFTQMIEQQDAAGMFVFSRTVSPAVMVSLYNSFPNGKKTEYKNIVRHLESNGAAIVNEWINTVNDVNGDESIVIDFIEQNSQAVIEYVKDQLTAEAAQFFDEVTQ